MQAVLVSVRIEAFRTIPRNECHCRPSLLITATHDFPMHFSSTLSQRRSARPT